MSSSFNRLVNKVRNNEAVLWVGSGFSFYAGMPSAKTFREIIINNATGEEKGILEGISNLSDVAKEFQELRQGSKQELMRILYETFSAKPRSVEYHELIRDIPQITSIVTTNYDRLFEQAYGNDIYPVINNTHLPIAANKRVGLYKIHGDISYPESIVLTTGDYTNFFRNQDNPIWNKVKTFFAEKTIIFLGFSLEDPNIEFLFDNILGEIREYGAESFLVSPNTPNHKVARLQRKRIQYIDMTGEDFITQLHKEIKSHLVEDILSGKVDKDIGTSILEKNGMLAEFAVSSRGTFLTSIGSADGGQMNLNITFDGIDFKSMLLNSPHDQFEIPFEHIKSLSSNFNGIKIPTFDANISSLVIKPLPIKEAKVDLAFRKSGKMINGVTMEVFGNNLDNLFVRFQHPLIKIEIDAGNRLFSFKTFIFPTLLHTKQIISFMYHLVLGEESLIVIMNDEDGLDFDFIQMSEKENIKMRQDLQQLIGILEKLQDIESFYKVSFRNFELELSDTNLQEIDFLKMNMENSRRKLNPLSFTIEFTDTNAFEKELLNKDNFDIKLVRNEPITFSILGKEIIIDRSLVIECKDAYFLNTDEIIKDIRAGKKVLSLELDSKEKGIYCYFEDSN